MKLRRSDENFGDASAISDCAKSKSARGSVSADNRGNDAIDEPDRATPKMNVARREASLKHACCSARRKKNIRNRRSSCLERVPLWRPRREKGTSPSTRGPVEIQFSCSSNVARRRDTSVDHRRSLSRENGGPLEILMRGKRMYQWLTSSLREHV